MLRSAVDSLDRRDIGRGCQHFLRPRLSRKPHPEENRMVSDCRCSASRLRRLHRETGARTKVAREARMSCQPSLWRMGQHVQMGFRELLSSAHHSASTNVTRYFYFSIALLPQIRRSGTDHARQWRGAKTGSLTCSTGACSWSWSGSLGGRKYIVRRESGARHLMSAPGRSSETPNQTLRAN